jgi:ABC-type lipoprotein release transport system permease subunit
VTSWTGLYFVGLPWQRARGSTLPGWLGCDAEALASLGIALGAGTATLLGRTAGVTLVLPGGRLALIVAVTIGAGLVAGLLPARRAARLDVLAAIANP